MEQYKAYKPPSPKRQEKMANQVAALLHLDRLPWTESGDYYNELVAFRDKWERYLHGLHPDFYYIINKYAGRFNQSQFKSLWHLWWLEEIINVFRPITKYKWTPESIKDASKIYLDASKKVYEKTGLYQSDFECDPSDNDWERLEIATVAVFLGERLSNHSQMRQTIAEFISTPFGKPIPKEKFKETDDSFNTYFELRRNHLYAARDEVLILLKMGQLLGEKQISDIKQNDQTENTKNVTEEKSFGGNKDPNEQAESQTFSYAHLCAMEFIAENKIYYKKKDRKARDTSVFRIFKYISQHVKSFSTPSDKNYDHFLPEACADYSKVLDTIEEWGRLAGKDTYYAKRYVAGSVMATELEEAYRLHFVCECVSVQKSISPGRESNFKKKEFIFQSVFLGNFISTFLLKKRRILITIDTPHNILNYNDDIHEIFYGSEIHHISYFAKSRILKNAQTDLLSILRNIFMDQLDSVWSDDDFCAVAQFYRYKYNVVEVLRRIKFPPLDNDEESRRKREDHFKRMHLLYKQFSQWADYGEEQRHEFYKEARK